MNTVVDSTNNKFNYKENYTSDVHIGYYDDYGTLKYQTKLIKAYPIGIENQELSYDSKEILEVTITLTCDYILNNSDIPKQ